VQRAVTGDPVISAPARMDILPLPDSAEVSLDGEAIGTGPLTRSPGAGEYKVGVQAPLFQSYEMSIRLLDGYDLQLPVDLLPTTGGAGGGGSDNAPDAYNRALQAISLQQWPEAEENLGEAIMASRSFVPAFLQLSALYLQQNRNREALGTLLDLLKNVPPDAHTYAVLSHSYAVFALKGPGDEDRRKFPHADAVNGFRIPGKAEDAAKLALTAAHAGVDLDPASVEAQLALGFALVASDPGTKNKEAALDAFEKAVAAQPSNADAHYGLGFALRVYAPAEGKKSGHASRTPFGPALPELCQADIHRAALLAAVDQVTSAIRIRPQFFEARQELAFLYHLLDDPTAARRAYEDANCRRGHASDRNEVAAVNIALSALYRQESRQYRGRVQRRWEDAAKGYLADAHEFAGDTAHFKGALNILRRASLASRICPYLPQAEQDLCEGRTPVDNSDQTPDWFLPFPNRPNTPDNPNRPPTTTGGRPGAKG
nr:PEGA domain-containing protein [Armatimonadota bacterium]